MGNLLKIEFTKDEIELMKECIEIRLKDLKEAFEDLKTSIKQQQTIVDVGVMYEKLLNKLKRKRGRNEDNR